MTGQYPAGASLHGTPQFVHTIAANFSLLFDVCPSMAISAPLPLLQPPLEITSESGGRRAVKLDQLPAAWPLQRDYES